MSCLKRSFRLFCLGTSLTFTPLLAGLDIWGLNAQPLNIESVSYRSLTVQEENKDPQKSENDSDIKKVDSSEEKTKQKPANKNNSAQNKKDRPKPKKTSKQLLEEQKFMWEYGYEVSTMSPENDKDQTVFNVSEASDYLYVSKILEDVFQVVLKNSDHYYIHKPFGDFKGFDLPFQMTKDDYDNIDISKIKISLFKSTAWQNGNADKYGWWLDNELVKSLFQGKEDVSHLIKEILLKLSIRRQWQLKKNWQKRYHEHYKSIIKPTKPEDSMELQIKYFGNFEDLKNYIHSKVENCKLKDSCTPEFSELNIVDQDKDEFFVMKSSMRFKPIG